MPATKEEKKNVEEFEKALEEVEKETEEEVKDNAEEETEEVQEEVEESSEEESEEVSDAVKAALEEQARLKAELEELRNSTSNVFEENEVLKAELEEQQKLAAMAKENAEMKAQLDAMKRGALVEGLIATGKLTKDLKEWAATLSTEQLEEFNAKAPKTKTILDQKNNGAPENIDKELDQWYKKQMKSRIL